MAKVPRKVIKKFPNKTVLSKTILSIGNGGRPREHDRDQIALDMIEWAKLPDSINLCGFCCSREPPIDPTKITWWAKECPEFRKAYNITKGFLGDRREKMLNAEKLHVKAYDLNAKTYDEFLKEEVMNQARFESSLKQEEAKSMSQTDIDRYESMMNQLKALQNLSKRTNAE